MGYYVKIYPDNPQESKLEEAAEILNKGGLIIFPTDTIYAIGASIKQPKALENLARFKKQKLEKSNFSLLFSDLSKLNEYTQQFDTPTYKLLRRNLPGPFTFILPANINVGRIFKNKKKTIGIRVPNNNIVKRLVELTEAPIVSTSLHHEDEILEYPTDAEYIFEDYKNAVDCVIDGGAGDNVPSTVVEIVDNMPILIRAGRGDFDAL